MVLVTKEEEEDKKKVNRVWVTHVYLHLNTYDHTGQ